MGRDNWDLASEREFIENLLCQRFNFLLALFGLVLASATQAKTQVQFQILLWVGFITIAPVAFSIMGAHWKLEWILRELFKDEAHPISRVNSAAKGRNARFLVGYVVPVICTLILFLGGILSSFNKLQYN